MASAPGPLARRGPLTEMRAADLRFTPAEAAGFLNQVIGLDLPACLAPAIRPELLRISQACAA